MIDKPIHPQRHATVDAALRDACARMAVCDAERLLAHTLSRSRAWLYAHGDQALTIDDMQRFAALLARREAGEPVAYLIGRRGFWHFDLSVTSDTLIPRPETERLVELALERIPIDVACRVADLGTGSGAIALALAHERPRAAVVATDRSAAALGVARGNAAHLGIANVAFRHGDWLQPLTGERYALIASNPPYIADGDAHLSQGDLRHEPTAALASGHDGLDAIRVIVRDASAHLAADGWLLLEHGWRQGDVVRTLLTAAGFVDVATEQDLESRDRVTLARRGP
ncbi:MAG: peptide chain release factor N(5)-glutamine methyltransferase [Luteimonas sp.]